MPLPALTVTVPAKSSFGTSAMTAWARFGKSMAMKESRASVRKTNGKNFGVPGRLFRIRRCKTFAPSHYHQLASTNPQQALSPVKPRSPETSIQTATHRGADPSHMYKSCLSIGFHI